MPGKETHQIEDSNSLCGAECEEKMQLRKGQEASTIFILLPKMNVMLFSNLFIWFIYLTIIFIFYKETGSLVTLLDQGFLGYISQHSLLIGLASRSTIFSYPPQSSKGLGLPHEASLDHCGSQMSSLFSFCKLWRPLPGPIL